MSHEDYMREALELARQAAEEGDVPVGCVIVKDGAIVGRGRNRREEKQATASHAEMEAIAQANEHLGTWRLDDCELYVTLEPCPMCAGALLQCRMDEVIIGCMSPKSGCAGSVMNLLEADGFNHKVRVIQGVLEEECSALMKDFFRELRVRVKEEKLARKAQENAAP